MRTGAGYEKNFSKFTPSAVIQYDLNDDANVYAKYVQGYKSGGTSVRSANPINFANGFDIEDVKSYELGVKGTLWDRRVRFNAAAFLMQFDGYQASIQTGATPGQRGFLRY